MELKAGNILLRTVTQAHENHWNMILNNIASKKYGRK